MKKISILLLIFALSVFVFNGCDILPPSGTEGEGEGDGEPEGVNLEIENYYQAPDGKTHVAGGTNKITVTFPSPVANAVAYITDCTGDYSSKQLPTNDDGSPVVLFPNEDKTIWTGSGTFGCKESVPATGRNGNDLDCTSCCASYIMVKAGVCEDDFCIQFPVIVDSIQPYAVLEVSTERCDDHCDPGKCAITFKSIEDIDPCEPGEQCCGDDCSGLANWAISVFEEDPFDECCLTPCYEPIFTDSGTGCPIDITTGCLSDDEIYYVVVNMVDNVGNEMNYYATIEMESICLPETVDFELARQGDNSYFLVDVTDFMSEEVETYPGWCTDAFTFISTGQEYNANIYPSTYLPDDFCAANVGDSASWDSETWSQINWVLNHWTSYTSEWEDVQVTIWNLIHNPGKTAELGWDCICSIGNILGNENNVTNMIFNADTGYIPGPDDLVAVVLLADDECPDYNNPDRGCPENCSPTWDANGYQMIIIEVLRSKIDCPCELVEVREYVPNDLGCTDWENQMMNFENIIGNCSPFL